MSNINVLKIVSGIDSLYYFIETNGDYDSLFLEILDEYQDQIDRFARNEANYKNEDITVDINGSVLSFIGKAQGFYWFRDLNGFFRIGFKDRQANKGLHNIQVQLDAKGIYTVGIKSVIGLIDSMLNGFTTGLKPITRADLNSFVAYDFSFASKQMFVTRKKVFNDYGSIGSKTSTSTLYIGKKPFLLRLYDKKKELFGKKEKIELMDEYLSGFEIDIYGVEPLWNLEFELHRSFLKSYGILTVDELFANAESLFKLCMDGIRLIDTTTITNEMIDSGHSNRAISLPIWETIKESYTLKAFEGSPISLKRLKRKEYKYTEQKAIEEHISLGRKARLHGVVIDRAFYDEVEKKIEDSFSFISKLKDEAKRLKEIFEDIEVYSVDTDKTVKMRVYKQDGFILPINEIVPFGSLSDYELIKEYGRIIDTLLKNPMDSLKEKIALQKTKICRGELIKRGLVEDEPIPF